MWGFPAVGHVFWGPVSLLHHSPKWLTAEPVNTLRPKRNEHFVDGIFKRIFFNENVWISINISLKFVPRGPINNIPTLVQVMAWRRSGDKPLSEPMMVRLPTHICVTRPQWVKERTRLVFSDTDNSSLPLVTVIPLLAPFTRILTGTAVTIHQR